MTKEYECYIHGENGKILIGIATEDGDGVIRVFNRLQPINGVFFIRLKKANGKAKI